MKTSYDTESSRLSIFSAILFRQRYKLLLRAREKDYIDNVGSEGSATEDDKEKKNAVFEIEGVPLHPTLEVRNVMTSNSSCNTSHVNVLEEAVHF